MRFLKKSIGIFILVFALGFLFTGAAKADAAAPAISFSNEVRTVNFTFPSSSYKYQVRLFNYKKKVIGTTDCYSFATFDNKTAKNRAYYYSFRYIKTDGTPVGNWTKLRPFATITNYRLSAPGNRRVRFKMPRVPGVSKYKVYLSTKNGSGYKKVRTVKSGKSFTIGSLRGNRFTYYKNYYYRIIPVIGGRSSQVYYSDYFYIKKVYY